MCLKTSNGEKSNLLMCVFVLAKKKLKKIEQSLQWKCTKKKKKNRKGSTMEMY